MLQEPDFAQSLLRDPNTPIIRKSRGTSTQGTSTHASSTQLAVMDDQRSKAGSVHSKVSSYHGSLHRSRDGRYARPPQKIGDLGMVGVGRSSHSTSPGRLPLSQTPQTIPGVGCPQPLWANPVQMVRQGRYAAVILLKGNVLCISSPCQCLDWKKNDIFRVCAGFAELITEQGWFSCTGAICVGKQTCPDVSSALSWLLLSVCQPVLCLSTLLALPK